MNNDYRDELRKSLPPEARTLLQALKRNSGENDEGKTLRELSRQLHLEATELRTLLNALQELKLVENAPEGNLSDGGRHYRLTMRGRGFLPE